MTHHCPPCTTFSPSSPFGEYSLSILELLGTTSAPLSPSAASLSLLHLRMLRRLFRQRRRHLSLCPTDQQGIRFGGSLCHHSGGHFSVQVLGIPSSASLVLLYPRMLRRLFRQR